MTIVTLKRRQDFLRAARAGQCRKPGFRLLARNRCQHSGSENMRIGFTCSKRIGGAAVRNRAKRRLREAARLVLPQSGSAGWDYVLIGIPGQTVSRSFSSLLRDLSDALDQVHRAGGKLNAPAAGP